MSVVQLSTTTPASAEARIARNYAALTNDEDRVSFLTKVLQKLLDRIAAINQGIPAGGVESVERAWAASQVPPINIDTIDNAQRALSRWLATLSTSPVPPPDLVTQVQRGYLDAITKDIGLEPAGVIPGAGEPRAGGRRRRKTRKTRKPKRKTRRRRQNGFV